MIGGNIIFEKFGGSNPENKMRTAKMPTVHLYCESEIIYLSPESGIYNADTKVSTKIAGCPV